MQPFISVTALYAKTSTQSNDFVADRKTMHIWIFVNLTIPMSNCVVRKLQIKNAGHTFRGKESFVGN